jgi:3D-(3,5/4)-trihydroxycyclohexane-1,2-dione acylhydrolase (decyclizing)
MVGDGNYLMMNTEIATAIQEGIKFTIVLLNNNGFGSIGALSQSLGSERYGTKYRLKKDGESISDVVPVDYVLNARSLGANVISIQTINELEAALVQASLQDKLTVIVIETDLEKGIPSYAWWEVPVAEVSRMDAVNTARKHYVNMKSKQRYFL